MDLQGNDDLCFFCSQPDNSLHCKIVATGLVVCQFTSQLLLILIAPIHGGMARLSVWLLTEMVYPSHD